ncbi:hypothetical protein [Flavobacterium capsici]|uniref:DUF1761 domain-containing protein n=1 Tax=Flavobacterium capsici TaxID=3075618 RepID=A0AA96F310_9FLAO|nr:MULTISPECIES: hypothetical protein [unclassified Flavobacterium]WNM18021.1 hypothetical protein RN608_08345 [Flavobacterium sp. PMR2A8]WNM22073.1 hypothetical protein RN605_01645 [Flavobacterium sp. PMTSA4]
MNVKNFLVAGIVGGIVDYLLGWLFYGMLFHDNFGGEDPQNMPFIALGCLSFGLFMSYIYTKWAGISTLTTGATAGAVIGIFMGLVHNFFYYAMKPTPDYNLMLLDIGISVVMGAIIGAVVGMVNGKMK